VKVYFLTINAFKALEAEAFFARSEAAVQKGIQLHVVKHDVQEILDSDLERVVRAKALTAYEHLRQPCVVEHGGLFFKSFPEPYRIPGTMGKVIWSAIGDRMCGLLRANDSRAAIARAILGYCDGRRIHLFRGETEGEVAERARGDYNNSNWDPIFVPQGSAETYAEMGPVKKATTSPSNRAWQQFLDRVAATDAAAQALSNR